jgi:hypothetical protein
MGKRVKMSVRMRMIKKTRTMRTRKRGKTRTRMRVKIRTRVHMQVWRLRPSTFQSVQQSSEHDSKTNPVPAIEVDTTTNGPFATSSAPKIHQKIVNIGKRGVGLYTHSPSHSAKAPAPALLAQAYWV